jgi:hypothetical protein
MDELIGEEIEVRQSPTRPRPVRFVWRGRVHEVAEVLSVRVDTGFGQLPAGSRRWYTRRHRRYYTVRDAAGEVFQMYLDYSNRARKVWWLVKRTT